MGEGFHLAGGGQPWRNRELPWEKTLDSPSVLASPWTRQAKAPVCGSEFLNIFSSYSPLLRRLLGFFSPLIT